MDSPIWGMMMSVGIFSFHDCLLSNRGPDANGYYSGWVTLIGKAGSFLLMGWREVHAGRHVGRFYALFARLGNKGKCLIMEFILRNMYSSVYVVTLGSSAGFPDCVVNPRSMTIVAVESPVALLGSRRRNCWRT
jgi:hypothetical protein